MDTFNPAAWLASFENVGGAYVLTDERLSLFVFPGDHEDDDLSKARILIGELIPERRDQLVGHLRSLALVEG